MNNKIFTILFILVSFVISVFGKEVERKVRNQDLKIVAVHLDKPIVLDGKLNEEIWNNSKGTSSFIQRDPVEGADPTQKTTVYIAYDNDAIYVAARMYDTHPDSITSRLSRRDVDVDTDGFLVYLDPYHDRRSGYYFALSAAGTQYDGV
jgi:hypothetical protein